MGKAVLCSFVPCCVLVLARTLGPSRKRRNFSLSQPESFGRFAVSKTIVGAETVSCATGRDRAGGS